MVGVAEGFLIQYLIAITDEHYAIVVQVGIGLRKAVEALRQQVLSGGGAGQEQQRQDVSRVII